MLSLLLNSQIRHLQLIDLLDECAEQYALQGLIQEVMCHYESYMCLRCFTSLAEEQANKRES